MRRGREDRQTPSQHVATWAGRPQERGTPQQAKALVASIALAIALGAAVWHSTGHYLREQAFALAAHQFAELETCLLGARRQAGIAPSERYRRILRDNPNDQAGWPQRCQPQASQLDTTLQSPAIADEVGPYPHATKTLLELGTAQAKPERLDRLWAQLEALALPAATGATTTQPAPRAQQPQLRKKQLRSLGSLRHFDQLAWSRDHQQAHQLRLFLPGRSSRLCTGTEKAKGSTFRLRCRSLPLNSQHHAAFRLASAAANAGDVVFRVDDRGNRGYFDGNTGRALFRPPSDFSQALIPSDRSIRILHAVLDEEDPNAVDNWRIAELRRGKALRNTRLRLPRSAVPILTEEGILFWPNRVAQRLPLFVAAWKRSKSGRLRLKKAERLGEITPGSKPVARCNSEIGQALLLQSETPGLPAHLLLRNANGWSRPIVLEESENILSMHCRQDDVALLFQKEGQHDLVVAECTPKGCRRQGSLQAPAQASRQLTVAVRKQHLVFAWTDRQGLVRIQSKKLMPATKVAAAGNGAPTKAQLVMDAAGHGGIAIRDIQFLSMGHQTVLLLLSKQNKVYAVAVSDEGIARPIAVEHP